MNKRVIATGRIGTVVGVIPVSSTGDDMFELSFPGQQHTECFFGSELVDVEYNFRHGDIGIRQTLFPVRTLEAFRYNPDGSTEVVSVYDPEARKAIVAFHRWKKENEND